MSLRYTKARLRRNVHPMNRSFVARGKVFRAQTPMLAERPCGMEIHKPSDRPLRVLSVFGTRPEAIKMAPVVLELRRRGEAIESFVCVTGQHREMLDQILGAFSIQPDTDLDLMAPNQTLNALVSRAVGRLDEVYAFYQPDVVLVQGDTSTAMAGAMAAFHRRIAVGHIEAGLRTGDRWSPFPEEVNRRLISLFASRHFAPTKAAVQALLAESVPPESVWLTGNTSIDTLRMVLENPSLGHAPNIHPQRRLILVTAHRRENFDGGIRRICEAIRILLERNSDIEIIYPVHPNPNVKSVVYELLSDIERAHLEHPADYFTFVRLQQAAHLILTDSGGIQEEAPFLGKPVLVLRENTERPEAVECGAAELVGTDVERIVSRTEALLRDEMEYRRMTMAKNPFGDGNAARRIVDVLLDVTNDFR